jgi:peptidoglycan/xylan/chitin deacetylase (PgdA/CDA1 family)
MATRAGVVASLLLATLVSGPSPAGAAADPGYEVVAADGGVFAFGGAGFYGSTGGIRLNQPIVGMAPTPSRNGYWLVASDGGIFAFGDAAFYGSTGGMHLNAPIVGMAATASGNGYWLVAIDGGMFAFGDAAFYGSAFGQVAGDAVVGMAITASGNGYWTLTVRGTVSAFGDASHFGDKRANAEQGARTAYIGIATTRTGNGYWLLALDGHVHAFGDATVYGDAPDGGQRRPVVSIAGEGHGSSGFASFLFSSYVARAHGSAGTWPGPNQVALTFDDGPNPTFTPQILDILEREGVPATFFEVGWAVEHNPALSRRIVDAGHSVQNHTWGHETLTRLDRGAITSNLTRTSDAIERATGIRPTCYRPPSGLTNNGVRDAGGSIGLTEVTWNGANGDWTTIGPGNMARNALGAADGRPLVILMHDGGGSPTTRAATVATLPSIIAGLRARGYEFVKLC